MSRLSHDSAIATICVSLMAAILVTLAPAVARASFPGGDGVIAYSGEGGIWALNPTTGNQLQLTTDPDDRMPSFSPSGDWLAFQRTVASTTTIFIARADGSDPTPLTGGSEPAFSPGGRQIVFARANGLFVTGLTPGSPIRRLTDHSGDGEPRWSSTGTIVFERIRVSHVNIQGALKPQVSNQLDTIIPPAARVSALLTYEQPEGIDLGEAETELHPDWSPNGRAIAVALCNGAASSHLPFSTVPTFVLHVDCSPDVWAPDGRRLAVPQKGALVGRRATSCPHFISAGTEISWQPLLRATLRVPTVPCEPRPPEAEQGVEPSQAARGSRTCYYDRKHHRRRCFTA
jgi:hypothetical protein